MFDFTHEYELLNEFIVFGKNEVAENVYLAVYGVFTKNFSEAAIMSRHEADNALRSIKREMGSSFLDNYWKYPLVATHEYGLREAARSALSVSERFNYDGFEIRYSLDPKFVDEPIKHDNFSAWLYIEAYFSIVVETEEKFGCYLIFNFDSYPKVLDGIKTKKSRHFSFHESWVILSKDPPVACEWEKFMSILENVRDRHEKQIRTFWACALKQYPQLFMKA